MLYTCLASQHFPDLNLINIYLPPSYCNFSSTQQNTFWLDMSQLITTLPTAEPLLLLATLMHTWGIAFIPYICCVNAMGHSTSPSGVQQMDPLQLTVDSLPIYCLPTPIYICSIAAPTYYPICTNPILPHPGLQLLILICTSPNPDYLIINNTAI